MKLMVFDVGGTEIKYSVMDESLERRESGSVPTPMGSQEEFFDVLCGLYEPHKGEVEGIAMSLPGFIDSERGICLGGGALRYNQGKKVAGPLSERTGVPVHIANDGKCAALAELRDGALRGCRNASVYIIGTGVGGGLIINGADSTSLRANSALCGSPMRIGTIPERRRAWSAARQGFSISTGDLRASAQIL